MFHHTKRHIEDGLQNVRSKYVLGAARGGDFSLRERDNIIGYCAGEGEIMRGHNHGQALAGAVAQLRGQCPRPTWIKRGCGLVHDQ